jgi:hypothetical protein
MGPRLEDRAERYYVARYASSTRCIRTRPYGFCKKTHCRYPRRLGKRYDSNVEYEGHAHRYTLIK